MAISFRLLVSGRPYPVKSIIDHLNHASVLLFSEYHNAGESWKTLNIHEENSVDLVFIDGDHTYEGKVVCRTEFAQR